MRIKQIAIAGMLLMPLLSLGIQPAGALNLQLFAGKWAASPEFCEGSVAALDAPVVIEAGRMTFYEWSCTVVDVKGIGLKRSVIATLDCDGEGQRWREKVVLGLDITEALMILRDDAVGFFGRRCRN